MRPVLVILAVLLLAAWPHLAPVLADAARGALAAELGACVLLARLIFRAARAWPWIAEYPYRRAS